jgi:hypothetical protein
LPLNPYLDHYWLTDLFRLKTSEATPMEVVMVLCLIKHNNVMKRCSNFHFV